MILFDESFSTFRPAVYLCCHFVLPIMEAQGGGVVVNVASIAALRYIGKPQVSLERTYGWGTTIAH